MPLRDVLIVGIRPCVVLIERMPDIGAQRVLVPWRPTIPEKRDIPFRPKGAVLKKAVVQLSAVVSSRLGIWGELEEVTKGNPELEQLRADAVLTMAGSKANNTL